METKIVQRLRSTSEGTSAPSERGQNFKEEGRKSLEQPTELAENQSTRTDVAAEADFSRGLLTEGDSCNSDTGKSESGATKGASSGDERDVEKSTVEGPSSFIPKVPESPPNRKPRPVIGKAQSPKEESEGDSHHGLQSSEEKPDQKSKGSKQSNLKNAKGDDIASVSTQFVAAEGSTLLSSCSQREGTQNVESLATLPSPLCLKEDEGEAALSGKAALEGPDQKGKAALAEPKGKAALEESSIQKGATRHEDAIRKKQSDAGIATSESVQKVASIKSRKCNLDEDLDKDFFKQEAPRKSLGGLGWFKPKEASSKTQRTENSKFPQRNQYSLFLFSTQEKEDGQGVRKVFAEANKTPKKEDLPKQVEDVKVDDMAKDAPDWQSWDEGGLSRQVSVSSCSSNASSVALSESPSVCRIRTFLRRCCNGSMTSVGDQ